MLGIIADVIVEIAGIFISSFYNHIFIAVHEMQFVGMAPDNVINLFFSIVFEAVVVFMCMNFFEVRCVFKQKGQGFIFDKNSTAAQFGFILNFFVPLIFIFDKFYFSKIRTHFLG
ncbi:MAG: hypothetical protein BWY70_00890 [Bacteroidetes bacterium ADurb.Bin408]|nr:MAG: hypothetical protein BWY70_00890 [Bacteroidetes bacterium ADurb.Bin408]